MSDQERISELLSALDGIANAPLTEVQRVEKAQPLLKMAGLTPAELGAALQAADLPWNQTKAREYGVDVDTWLEAMRVVGLPASQTIDEFLARLHQAEAAAAMLRAGYRPQVDPSGRIDWLSPQAAP